MARDPRLGGAYRRWLPVPMAALMALLLAADPVLAPPGPAIAAPATGTLTISDFDRLDGWSVVEGSADVAVEADASAGRTALAFSGIGSDGRLELMPRVGPLELGGLPRTLLLDVVGNSGWRPLYLEVRDATGEIFHYWVGRIASGGWETVSVDLTAPPASSVWGDGDGVLDLPVSFFKLVVDPRPNGAASHVAFAIDNLRMVVEPWTPVALGPRTFVPSAGGAGTVSMQLGRTTPYLLTLRDELDRVRTWRGWTAAGTSSRLAWSGRDDLGVLMQGSIEARLTTGGAGEETTIDIPYLGGLPRRAPVDPSSIVGMNTFLSEPDPSRRSFVEWQARRLEDARDSMIRETFVWDRLEPRQHWFEWAKFDQAVEIANAHGIEVLGVLAFSADWASSAPPDAPAAKRTLYAPRNLDDFAAYVRAVVRRYGDSIDAWEVWNEPNHPKFWLPKPDPEAYAALLAVAAEVIRSEDPGATILLGGIVGTDVRYLDRLRAAGAWSDFDVLALHGYVRLSPEASGLGGWFDRAMAYVARHGSKPVWLTEICWPIAPAEPGIPEVTAGLQAAYLGRTYARAAEAGLARVFWYSLIDHPSGTGSRYDACGTFDVGQQARSTYQALRTIGAAFDGSVTMGPYDPAATSRLAVDPAGGRWRAASGSSITVLTGTLSAAYRLVSTTDSAAFTTSLPLPGRPTSLAATVTGDGSANSILASFTDATGERCSASFAALRSESRSIRLPLDGTAANWRCSGGDGDQRLDAPVRLSSLAVYPTGIGELSGSFRLTGLSVGEGPVDRGIVLAHGTSLRLLVSRSVASSGATTAIVLPGGIATELVDGATRVLTVERGRLRLGVGPQIRAVDVPLGLTHRTITPPEYTWLRWLAGDGTNARPQVTGPDGRWVKTAPSKVWRPGVQSIAWDGRVATSDGRRIAAPPGRYTIRLVVTAPDGRVGTLQASVDVR